MGAKKVILAQFNAADGYPPVLNQAGILAEQAEVTLLDTGGANARMIEIPGVRRLRVTWENNASKSVRASRLKARLDFARRSRALASQGPDAVIAFEPDAIALMMTHDLPNGCLRIGHLHEHPSPGVYSSPVDRIAVSYVRRHANGLDLLVVADEDRGRLLKERWKLKESPLVVRNCPRRLDNLSPSCLQSLLDKRGIKHGSIVYYQGSIGAHQGIDAVVASMKDWPDNSILVLVGSVSPAFRTRMDTIANEIGTSHRIFEVGRVPYDEVFSYTVGADIALSLLDPESEQWRFSAGASNKRFEYVASWHPSNYYGSTRHRGNLRVQRRRVLGAVGRRKRISRDYRQIAKQFSPPAGDGPTSA